MANRKFWLGILVFGAMLVLGLEAQTDSRLNGRWVLVEDGIETEVNLNNGNFEMSISWPAISINRLSVSRGSYTTNRGEIAWNPTHYHGAFSNMTFVSEDLPAMLEPKWYSTNEMILALRSKMMELGLTGAEFNEFVSMLLDEMVNLPASTYSVDGNSLIMVSTVDGERTVEIYTRR